MPSKGGVAGEVLAAHGADPAFAVFHSDLDIGVSGIGEQLLLIIHAQVWGANTFMKEPMTLLFVPFR